MAGGEDPRAVTVVQVAAGEAHTLALTASGSVYGWGRGLGHLGAGVSQDELAPTLIEIVLPSEDDEISSQNSQSERTREEIMQRNYREAQKSRITQIAAGAYHSLALAGDGTMFSWGFNACIQSTDFLAY